MATTPNLGLTTFTTADGATTKFVDFRAAVAGETSNMTLIDTAYGNIQSSIGNLRSAAAYMVNASTSTANNYIGSVTGMTSYYTGMLISLKVDVNNTSAVTLNINSLGVKNLKKINSSGTTIDLSSGDLIANKYYLFAYNGTNFVLASTDGSSAGTTYEGVSPISVSGSSISLSDTGVTPGTYNKVQVNSKGMVVSASNVVIAASHIILDGTHTPMTDRLNLLFTTDFVLTDNPGTDSTEFYIRTPGHVINSAEKRANLTFDGNFFRVTDRLITDETFVSPTSSIIAVITASFTNFPPTEDELVAAIGSPFELPTGKGWVLNPSGNFTSQYLAVNNGVHFTLMPLSTAYFTSKNVASATNASASLITPTYDSSGQAMHPSVIDFKPGYEWNGYRYWMSMTPYTNGNSSVENPSILSSNDGTTWDVPQYGVNPIIPYPGAGLHNSDSCLLYDAKNDLLYLYWVRSSATVDELYCSHSSDGVTWSASSLCLAPDPIRISSPYVVFDGVDYQLYTVDGLPPSTTFVRRTCSTPGGTFAAASTCTLNNAPASKYPWHSSVVKRGEVYHSFMVLSDSGGDNQNLYFMHSNDGLDWTYNDSALLNPGAGWDSGVIYQSSGIPTQTGYNLYYSARKSPEGTWGTGLTTVTLSET